MISSFNLAMLSPRLAPAGGSSLSFMRCSRRDSRPPEALFFNLCAVLDTCSSLSIYALLSRVSRPSQTLLFEFMRCSSRLALSSLFAALLHAFPLLFRDSRTPEAHSLLLIHSRDDRALRLASLSRIAGWDSLCCEFFSSFFFLLSSFFLFSPFFLARAPTGTEARAPVDTIRARPDLIRRVVAAPRPLTPLSPQKLALSAGQQAPLIAGRRLPALRPARLAPKRAPLRSQIVLAWT